MILWTSMRTSLWLSMCLFLVDGLNRCVDCKFFKKKFLENPKFGTCAFFPKEVDEGYGFVTGKSTARMEFEYCAVARQFELMCGNQGKYYQKK